MIYAATMRQLCLIVTIILVPFGPCLVLAQAPSEISFQGRIEKDGSLWSEPYAKLNLRLYDSQMGGSPIWTESHDSVSVVNGHFNVMLGSIEPLSSLEFYRPLWLEVEVQDPAGTMFTLSPRTKLASSPYTMGLALPILQDKSVGGTAFTINNTGSGDGIKGESNGSVGRGLFGQASAFEGANVGVYGISQSASGTGVYGLANTSVTGNSSYGVFGKTNSTTGFGVYGEHTDGHYGHLGSDSTGVRGEHANGNYGVLGWPDAGASATHFATGNHGEIGTVNSGVRGTNFNGNLGELGAGAYGVLGYATNGNAGTFSTLGTTNSSPVVTLTGGQFGFTLLEGHKSHRRFAFTTGGLTLYSTSGSGNPVARLEASNELGLLRIYRGTSEVITLDPDVNGDARVITEELEITGGSDLSEYFEVSGKPKGEAPEPGALLSIDPDSPGRLRVSDRAYDPLIAGVVSGAGGVETGVIMGQEGSEADGETPVALVGRVYVLVDAAHGAVRPGDLLTSSPTPGHAMPAGDREAAFGSVLGKAMTGLDEGRGLVLTLINLQ